MPIFIYYLTPDKYHSCGRELNAVFVFYTSGPYLTLSGQLHRKDSTCSVVLPKLRLANLSHRSVADSTSGKEGKNAIIIGNKLKHVGANSSCRGKGRRVWRHGVETSAICD